MTRLTHCVLIALLLGVAVACDKEDDEKNVLLQSGEKISSRDRELLDEEAVSLEEDESVVKKSSKKAKKKSSKSSSTGKKTTKKSKKTSKSKKASASARADMGDEDEWDEDEEDEEDWDEDEEDWDEDEEDEWEEDEWEEEDDEDDEQEDKIVQTPVVTPTQPQPSSDVEKPKSDVEKYKKDATKKLKSQTRKLAQSIKFEMILGIQNKFTSSGILDYEKNTKVADLKRFIERLSGDDLAKEISRILEDAKNKTDQIEGSLVLKFKSALRKKLKKLASAMDKAMTELKFAVEVLEDAVTLMKPSSWRQAEEKIGAAVSKIQNANLQQQASALEKAAEHVAREEWERAVTELKKTGI